MPFEMSGGEQQRVDIARALLNSPKLILADEPTGNLDPETSDEIMQLLFRISGDYGTSVIMATHDYRVISKFPARMVENRKRKGHRQRKLRHRLSRLPRPRHSHIDCNNFCKLPS